MPSEVVTLTFSASGGALQDAVKLTLPVLRPTSAETVATAGQVDTQHRGAGRRSPPTPTARRASLRIDLSPSLAAASRDSLRYLESFDYDCTEQTVSKFFPNAVTYLALKRLGIEREDLRQGAGGQRRPAPCPSCTACRIAMAAGAGGPASPAGRSSPPMPCWRCFTARQAGFPVDSGRYVPRRAVPGRRPESGAQTSATPSSYNERAFVVFVLSEMGRTDMVSRASLLFDQRADLDLYGKAFLLMALKRGGQSQARPPWSPSSPARPSPAPPAPTGRRSGRTTGA